MGDCGDCEFVFVFDVGDFVEYCGYGVVRDGDVFD